MRQPLGMPAPTDQELARFDTLYLTRGAVRLRTRARILLLAGEQRLAAPASAPIVREDEQTVRFMSRCQFRGWTPMRLLANTSPPEAAGLY